MISEEKVILGGYFLVKITRLKDLLSGINQSCRISLDDNISKIYPICWALPGNQISKENMKILISDMGITNKEYREMLAWIAEQWTNGTMGYNNVFFNIKTAQEFKRKYLKHDEEVKLIAVGIDKEHLKSLQDENGLLCESSEGVLRQISKMNYISDNCECIGYEVLSYDGGGFYSPWTIVNSIELKKFNIGFNNYGLFANEKECESLSRYLNGHNLTAELAYWLPWSLFECPAQI